MHQPTQPRFLMVIDDLTARLWARLHTALSVLQHDEDGYSVETAVIVAAVGLAAIGLAVIIGSKIAEKGAAISGL
jgi:hypothetical protein